jgi:hypothetical protein
MDGMRLRPPGASPLATVFTVRRLRFFLLTAAIPVGLSGLGSAIGWQRGNHRDGIIGLVGMVVFAGLFGGLTALAGRQRLVIDGARIWVRTLRWHGPFTFADVVAVTSLPTRYGAGLALIQPVAGRAVGMLSAITTAGQIRPGRYRHAHAGRLRYVVLPVYVVRSADAMRLLAPPLLRRPDIAMDVGARALLRPP